MDWLSSWKTEFQMTRLLLVATLPTSNLAPTPNQTVPKVFIVDKQTIKCKSPDLLVNNTDHGQIMKPDRICLNCLWLKDRYFDYRQILKIKCKSPDLLVNNTDHSQIMKPDRICFNCLWLKEFKFDIAAGANNLFKKINHKAFYFLWSLLFV